MKILVWGCVAVGVLSVLVFLGAPLLFRRTACSNDRNASASLKTLASAQADYRGNDRDENKDQDYWRGDVSGLYSVLPAGSTEMIKLIELSVAAADASPLGKNKIGDRGPGQIAQDQYAEFVPKAGYFYLALRHVGEDPKALDSRRFAACAYPADYPRSGKWTFVIDEGNTVFRRDLGRQGPPEVFPDAESLKRDWSKLD